MKRRDVMKVLGFSMTTLGAGGYLAYSSVKSSEPDCFEDLEADEFYERLGSHEGDDLYSEDYDITGDGVVGETDYEIFMAYENSEYHPELSMYCNVEEMLDDDI